MALMCFSMAYVMCMYAVCVSQRRLSVPEHRNYNMTFAFRVDPRSHFSSILFETYLFYIAEQALSLN